jgi:hypothetical protein
MAIIKINTSGNVIGTDDYDTLLLEGGGVFFVSGVEKIIGDGSNQSVIFTTPARTEVSNVSNIIGSSGYDEISLPQNSSISLSGVEKITFKSEDSFIFGTPASEQIHGSNSSDIIFGGGGSDVIDGGNGIDIVIVSGKLNDYIFDWGNNSLGASSGSGGSWLHLRKGASETKIQVSKSWVTWGEIPSNEQLDIEYIAFADDPGVFVSVSKTWETLKGSDLVGSFRLVKDDSFSVNIPNNLSSLTSIGAAEYVTVDKSFGQGGSIKNFYKLSNYNIGFSASAEVNTGFVFAATSDFIEGDAPFTNNFDYQDLKLVKFNQRIL